MSTDNIQRFTVSVYAENHIGLAGRLMQIFTRRKINIDSLTTSESEIEGIYRFTIVIHVSKENVIKVVIADLEASSMADMGKVMGVASKQLSGQADGKVIAAKVRQLLS